jgi:DNA-binding transcriptional ArsR family regulator
MSDPFETLADPTRRRIVESLRAGERSVSELVDSVDVAQSGVSRHLRILHEAGFVEVRAAGQRRLYSLRSEPFERLDAWMNDFRQLMEHRLDRLGEAIAKNPARKDRTA